MTYEEWSQENWWHIANDNDARHIWNAALDSAANEVNKLALDHDAIVQAVVVIEQHKDDT